MIVDACLVIAAVTDPGPLGAAARAALAAQPAAEPLSAPGHFAIELMSGLHAAANRPGHPLQPADIDAALADAEGLSIAIEGTPWSDVHRGWELSRTSLRYADAIYVAAAERHSTALLTTDTRIERAGAAIGCPVITITAPPGTEP